MYPPIFTSSQNSNVFDPLLGRARTPVAPSSVFRLFLRFGPEAVAGAMDENVFERGLAHADRLNLAGKCFHQSRNEAMAVFEFDAHLIASGLVAHDRGIDLEACADALGEGLGVARSVEQDHVATDFVLEFRRRTQGDQLTFV